VKFFRFVLSFANLFTSLQVFPFSPISSTDLLHVFLGLPRLRAPCGFQSGADFCIVLQDYFLDATEAHEITEKISEMLRKEHIY
jgi:hypothetical protein